MKDKKDDDFDSIRFSGLSIWSFERQLSLFKNTHLEEKSTFSKITDEQRAKIIETIVRDFDIEGLSFEHIETERKWFLELELLFLSLSKLCINVNHFSKSSGSANQGKPDQKLSKVCDITRIDNLTSDYDLVKTQNLALMQDFMSIFDQSKDFSTTSNEALDLFLKGRYNPEFECPSSQPDDVKGKVGLFKLHI